MWGNLMPRWVSMFSLQQAGPPDKGGQQPPRQRHEAVAPGLYVLCSGSAWPAGEEVVVYPHPVALPVPTALDSSSGSSCGSAVGCSSGGSTHRLELVLPAALAAALEHDISSSLRVIVSADMRSVGAAALLDQRCTAADVLTRERSPRLALHIPVQAPPSAGRGAQQLVLHLLLRTSLEQPEALVARLPLLVLPPAACSELQALIEAMVAACGGDAVAAYADSFSPLAADMAAVLQLGAFPGAAAAWIGINASSMCEQLAAAARELLDYFCSQEGGLPACTQLVAAAAQGPTHRARA